LRFLSLPLCGETLDISSQFLPPGEDDVAPLASRFAYLSRPASVFDHVHFDRRTPLGSLSQSQIAYAFRPSRPNLSLDYLSTFTAPPCDVTALSVYLFFLTLTPLLQTSLFLPVCRRSSPPQLFLHGHPSFWPQPIEEPFFFRYY